MPIDPFACYGQASLNFSSAKANKTLMASFTLAKLSIVVASWLRFTTDKQQHNYGWTCTVFSQEQLWKHKLLSGPHSKTRSVSILISVWLSRMTRAGDECRRRSVCRRCQTAIIPKGARLDHRLCGLAVSVGLPDSRGQSLTGSRLCDWNIDN